MPTTKKIAITEEEREEEKEEEETDGELMPIETPEDAPDPFEGFEQVVFPAKILACALKARYSPMGVDHDVDGNEAMLQPDKSVRVSMKLIAGGHQRFLVALPEEVTLLVKDIP